MSPPILSGLLQRQYDQTQRNFTKQLELNRYSTLLILLAVNSRLQCLTYLHGHRVRSLGFDTSKQISSIHKGGVTWLDLEHAEHRYLLAGSADCSVAVYDVAQPVPANTQSNSGPGDFGSVLKITSTTPGCHQYSVSSVAWYPIDTGLFVTGSFDHQVKVRICCESKSASWCASTLLSRYNTSGYCRSGMRILVKLPAALLFQTGSMVWQCHQQLPHTAW